MFQIPRPPDTTRDLAIRLNAPEVDGIGNAPKNAKEGAAVLDVSEDRPVLCQRIKGKWITIATRPGVKGGVERKPRKPRGRATRARTETT